MNGTKKSSKKSSEKVITEDENFDELSEEFLETEEESSIISTVDADQALTMFKKQNVNIKNLGDPKSLENINMRSFATRSISEEREDEIIQMMRNGFPDPEDKKKTLYIRDVDDLAKTQVKTLIKAFGIKATPALQMINKAQSMSKKPICSTGMDLRKRTNTARALSSYVPGFDALTNGGLREGDTVLVWGPGESGKSTYIIMNMIGSFRPYYRGGLHDPNSNTYKRVLYIDAEGNFNKLFERIFLGKHYELPDYYGFPVEEIKDGSVNDGFWGPTRIEIMCAYQGVDPDVFCNHLDVVYFDSFEETATKLEWIMQNKINEEYSVIGIDSLVGRIRGMFAGRENFKDRSIFLTHVSGGLMALQNKNNAILIATTHAMNNVGQDAKYFPLLMVGGQAIKHIYNIIINVERMGKKYCRAKLTAANNLQTDVFIGYKLEIRGMIDWNIPNMKKLTKTAAIKGGLLVYDTESYKISDPDYEKESVSQNIFNQLSGRELADTSSSKKKKTSKKDSVTEFDDSEEVEDSEEVDDDDVFNISDEE